ncbi:hypothetical protein [Nocardiopsis sp. NRRL B-16309]|uniref:hypothetical protein n=1 Tax=Nocardiopsis sp. NRRL B-16309 TaxID=1519494 RepID=UPI0006BF445C|nr:hypothetical protein [Nocardiopsis sp. NRRL B-16309]KOX13179.1 hypothetical protein ADL05_19615 [Nocardiopsis sp. NRRL B-16309]
MSFEERRIWIYLAVAVLVPAAYLVVLLARAAGTDVADLAYQRPLVTALGVSLAATILLNMVSAALWPKGAYQKDPRDKEIDRRGDYVGFVVMSVLTVVPFSLALLEEPYFWIANTIYLAYVTAAVASSAVKLVAYRRGF